MTKMKVDKKQFTDAILFIRKINSTQLKDLDCSGFFEGNLNKAKKEFSYTGLSNKSFILSDFVDNHFPKNKRKFYIEEEDCNK